MTAKCLPKTLLLISDLHLSPQRPDLCQAFLRFLDEKAAGAEALYILGDFVDAWIGDDDDTPLYQELAAALKALSARGTDIFFMHGNRDFLLGRRFARASGMKILPDPTLVDLYGTPTLLMHGDTLCSDDVEYQRFRSKARNRFLQWLFLALPLSRREQIARKLRGRSEQAKKDKPSMIMDVTPATVESVLRRHDYPRLIHGHTHRPARHEHRVDGRTCERWVLADWYEGGSYLICDPGGCRPQAIA